MGKPMAFLLHRLAPITLVLASACAAPRPAPPQLLRSAPAKVDLPAGAHEIEAVRGHAFRRDLPIHEVTRGGMRAVIARRYAKMPRVDDEATAFAQAFGFAQDGATVTRSASIRLHAEQLVGLYVPEERSVYVRARAGGATSVDPSDVLHEIAHALQDDVFGFEPLDTSIPMDELLARKAVYEGDATVAAWEAMGARAGKPVKDVVEDHRSEVLVQSAMLGVPQELESSPLLEHSSPLVRAELAFPYTAGALLVAEAYLAGGNTLVDGLFRKLPTTTEQVLHAKKYFAGERPVPVGVPRAPDGYTTVTTGTMGELRVRAFLQQLGLPPEQAIVVAEGWGGDAYAVVQHAGESRYAVLWSTAWDDVEAATRFAAALEDKTRCARDCPHGPVGIRREGARVAWTRGLDDAAPLDALLALVGKAPAPEPPHGEIVLAAARAIAEEVLLDVRANPSGTYGSDV
jgi:hypothetical protein